MIELMSRCEAEVIGWDILYQMSFGFLSWKI